MKRRIILFFAAVGMISCGTSQTKDNDPWGEIDPGKVEAQSVAKRSRWRWTGPCTANP